MDSFSDLNNAFNNKGVISDNNQSELEKQARKINDRQKITNFINNQSDNIPQPCHQSSDLNMSNIDNYYSAQGNYNDIYKPEKTNGMMIKDIHHDDISLSLDSSSSNSSDHKSSISSIDTHEIDRHIKTKSKYNSNKISKRHKCIDFDLTSVDSIESLDSGESLLRHIRFCNECKNKVLILIKNKKDIGIDHHNSKIHQYDTPVEIKMKKNTDLFSFNIPELKEIIIVCLIGFLIIIFLDLILRIEK